MHRRVYGRVLGQNDPDEEDLPWACAVSIGGVGELAPRLVSELLTRAGDQSTCRFCTSRFRKAALSPVRRAHAAALDKSSPGTLCCGEDCPRERRWVKLSSRQLRDGALGEPVEFTRQPRPDCDPATW
jgi:hypothetical protein